MKQEWLNFMCLIDFVFGGGGVILGVLLTFTHPWAGWGLILAGAWLLLHFYYLIWEVEEILVEEKKNEK